MNTLSVKSLAEEDRPREKALRSGIRALSNSELIAILINSGTGRESAIELSKRILNHVGNDLHELARLRTEHLCAFNGIGSAKALKIEAALELGRRRQRQDTHEREIIRSSRQAYHILAPCLMDLRHEEFWVLFLSRKMTRVGLDKMSSGGMHGTVVDPKIIFQKALTCHAYALILAHNHPSGNAKPSMQDISLTKRLIKAAELLEMKVVDHLIIYDQSYYSFQDEGDLS